MLADRTMLIIIYLAVNFFATFATKENCTVPEIQNGYVHELTKYSEYILLEPGALLPHNTEILVTCDEDFDITANRLVDENFALKCDDGNFEFVPFCVAKPNYEMMPGRGRLMGNRGRDRFHKILNKLSCLYEVRGENIMAFHNGSQITRNTTFHDSTTLNFRCTDISTFSLLGNMSRTCEEGKWSGKTPHCIRLYPHSFYSPPVISHVVALDEFTILDNGSLSVLQHTNLTLHCLWLKDNGDPYWRRNGKYIDNEVIPSNVVWNESESSLDLFIPRIQLRAAGSYVCQTPNRKRHGIDVVVKPRFLHDFPGYEGDTSACMFEPRPWSNTLVFINGKEISKLKNEYLNGTILNIICVNVLQYKMEGNKTIVCKNGSWRGLWPNCTQLNDSADSSPPLDIQITGSDKSYFVDDNGIVIVPKETTVSFVCQYSGGKPIMALHGARLRQIMGQTRAGSSTNWYLRADIPTNSISFTFFCKIPRKDLNLFHSVEVVAKGSCKMDARKMQYRWRGSRILPAPDRQMFVEEELVNVQCDNSTSSVIPTYFRCGDKGNWIAGPNQRCRPTRKR